MLSKCPMAWVSVLMTRRMAASLARRACPSLRSRREGSQVFVVRP
jgi:hypothetical protein